MRALFAPQSSHAPHMWEGFQNTVQRSIYISYSVQMILGFGLSGYTTLVDYEILVKLNMLLSNSTTTMCVCVSMGRPPCYRTSSIPMSPIPLCKAYHQYQSLRILHLALHISLYGNRGSAIQNPSEARLGSNAMCARSSVQGIAGLSCIWLLGLSGVLSFSSGIRTLAYTIWT